MKKLLLVLILSYVAFPQGGKSVLTQKQRDSIQVMIDATVSGTTPLRTKIVYVEDYGTDEAAIQEAIDSAGTGGIVEFEPNRVYSQTNGLKVNLYDGITLRGNNATLKRGNQQYTTLSATEDKNSTVLNVDSVPSGWKVGDLIQVYADSNYTTSNLNAGQEITEINGNAITISPALGLRASYVDLGWQIGDKVRKVYAQLIGTIEYSCNVENLIFDGNKNNNRGNYYWSLNEAIWIFKRSHITDCKFYNMPNENIFGNGFTITGNYAQNLNGSFVHYTALNTYDLDNFYGFVSNNTTYNTNIMSSATITGHSEGVITFSATAGRSNIHNNYFFNGGGAVMGYFAYGSGTDGSLRDLVFSNNFCRGFSSITALLYYNYNENVPGHFVIAQNVFDSCGTNDWDQYELLLSLYDSIYIAGNQLWGGTTWDNLPIYTNIQQSFQTGNIVTEDITASDITSSGLTVSNGDIYVWDASVLGTEIYDFANAVSDTSGSEANDSLGWYSLSTGAVSVESSDIQTGTYALKFTAANNQSVEGMRDTLTGFGVGQTYKISLWAKAGVTADTISQKLTGWLGFDVSPNEYVTDGWAQYVYYLTATNDTVVIAAYGSTLGIAYGGSVGDEILIDNLSIQKVQGGDIIARGNLGYGNYYFENPTPTNGYVLKTDGNGVATWQPDISTSGTGLFNPDGITIDTTAGGLARIVPAIKSRIDSVWTKQPLEATLTDIADGTIAENLVNTANPWADNEVANNLTIDDAGIASTIARDSEMALLYIDTLRIAGWSIGSGNTDIDTLIAGSFGGIKIPNDYTVTEVAAYTNTGTVTFNIEERAETTPNTSGTDVMTSDLVADTDQQETGTFSNATLDRDDWLILTIVSITGEPTIFSVTVRGVKTD